ncbi:hypothetical protein ACFQ60_13220 [Streptomyces zhihengii]
MAAVRDVVAAVDEPDRSVHKVLGEATNPIVPAFRRAPTTRRSRRPGTGSANSWPPADGGSTATIRR